MTINRTEVSRALAKAIAYKAVNNDKAARAWAARLVTLLETADILSDGYRVVGEADPGEPKPCRLQRNGVDCGTDHF